MSTFISCLKKITFTTTFILAGILLYILVLSSGLINTVMTSEFHRGLFIKNDIYSQVQNLINASLQDVFNNLSSHPAELTEQQKEVFSILKNSTSPEMVNKNLDSIRNGIFQYFSGSKKSLPDIYIDTSSNSNTQEMDDTNKSSHVLSKIKRINLSAILLSVNRGDILDKLLLIKLMYYIINSLPGFLLLVLAFLYLTALVIGKKPGEMIKWLSGAFLVCSFLNVASGIGLLLFSYKILHQNIYSLSIPLDSKIILSYIRGCLFPLSLFLITLGVLLILLTFGVLSSGRLTAKIAPKLRLFKINLKAKHRSIVKYCIIALFSVLVVTGLGLRLYLFKKNFDSNNFSSVISKYTSSNAVTQVISAKNDTIYTLQVKLVDVKSSEPVPNVQIQVSGKTANPEKYYNLAGITDETGTVKFTLAKGTFHLIFSPVSSSSNYILPSPFFFDLKSVGTTIITINLDTHKKNNPVLDIAEIEVLDEDNLPVEGLELFVEDIKLPGQENKTSVESTNEQAAPNKFYSITNKEGIAIFRLPSGSYNVSFSKDKFPEGYIIPEAFEINNSHNVITRYTIRLVKKPS